MLQIERQGLSATIMPSAEYRGLYVRMLKAVVTESLAKQFVAFTTMLCTWHALDGKKAQHLRRIHARRASVKAIEVAEKHGLMADPGLYDVGSVWALAVMVMADECCASTGIGQLSIESMRMFGPVFDQHVGSIDKSMIDVMADAEKMGLPISPKDCEAAVAKLIQEREEADSDG